jgi:Uma2 family endonuclease
VIREIVLPETRPDTEWLRGRAVQKVSPKRKHGVLQLWFGARLSGWARGKGHVGSEWRFRVAPPNEVIRPLVPDLSYLSYDRMRGATDEEWDTPLVAPDAAVEIRSPGDRRADLIVIDPRTRTVSSHDASGVHTYTEAQSFEHAALPGFAVNITEMFAVLEIERR